MTLPEPVSSELARVTPIAARLRVQPARPLRVVALADAGGPLADVLQHRFGGRGSLAGHAPGNLVLAALTEMHGDFLQAIRSASRLLDTRGTVLPSTLDEVQLVAELEDGRRVVGERHLVRAGTRVRRVFLHPSRPFPAEGVLEPIASADLVTLGPGSLYSSVLPNLLVDGVAEALRSTRARRVLVANLMTEPGETAGMGAVDHVRAVMEHAGPVVDVALLNSEPLDAARLDGMPGRGRSRCGPTSSASVPWGSFRSRRICSARTPAAARCPEARTGAARGGRRAGLSKVAGAPLRASSGVSLVRGAEQGRGRAPARLLRRPPGAGG